jgi:hypothetical protein
MRGGGCGEPARVAVSVLDRPGASGVCARSHAIFYHSRLRRAVLELCPPQFVRLARDTWRPPLPNPYGPRPGYRHSPFLRGRAPRSDVEAGARPCASGVPRRDVRRTGHHLVAHATSKSRRRSGDHVRVVPTGVAAGLLLARPGPRVAVGRPRPRGLRPGRRIRPMHTASREPASASSAPVGR